MGFSYARRSAFLSWVTAVAVLSGAPDLLAQARPRARELGIAPGVLPPGKWNAITDVSGVLVGHATVQTGDSVRTGVTAILPHSGNLFLDRVPAAVHVGNGFGKLVGGTQVAELGELESPILLTCTLCVWKAADGLVDYLLTQPEMSDVRSVNPVVGETNDGQLNAIRDRAIAAADVRRALTTAAAGPVAEGSVGAGTGTVAFEWKGGIGTSSRVVSAAGSPRTVGVLVQSNFGRASDLIVLGVPVGRMLGRVGIQPVAGARGEKGSIMMIVATDAPLGDRNLRRLAARAMLGVARTGSIVDNGSGDYVIAFSTHPEVRRRRDAPEVPAREIGNEAMSELFRAVVEATEEAIYNSLFTATAVAGNGHRVEALPADEVLRILRDRGALAP